MAIDGKKTNTEPSCDRVTREIVGEAVEKVVKEIKKLDLTQVKGDWCFAYLASSCEYYRMKDTCEHRK